MTDNPYQPPAARVADFVGDGPRLYVVAPRKFLILFLGTAGIYQIYWFYKNWALLNTATNLGVWPVMRAIFSIFFTHALFREIDARLKPQPTGRAWPAYAMATLYVAGQIVNLVASQLSGRGIGAPWLGTLPLILMGPFAWLLLTAQRAINRAENDPDGSGNRALTAANWVWLAIGVFYWGLIAVGYYQIFGYARR
jgi:hypothetical protein